jgi:hypothetical protein
MDMLIISLNKILKQLNSFVMFYNFVKNNIN